MNDLARLLDELHRTRDTPDAGSPTPQPTPGQSVRQWLTEIESLRAVHDHSAIEHRQQVSRLSQRLFAQTTEALLPRLPVELTRTQTIVVTAQGQLQDVIEPLPADLPTAPPVVDDVPVRRSVTVRITSPPKPTSAVIYLHGGGFWMGGGKISSIIDRLLLDQVAAAANALVCNVDYRLAPEYPYPASDLDALAVLDAVREGAFGVTDVPVALLGTSSGAMSATRVARLNALRAGCPQGASDEIAASHHTPPSHPNLTPDTNTPPSHADIAALALVVPSVNLTSGQQSATANPVAWKSRSQLLRGYLGDIDPSDPWVSPGVLDRLEGMPPTFAVIAEQDEVAAGGFELCAAIQAAGQSAEARRYPMTHVVATPEVEARYITDISAFLRGHLLGRVCPPVTAS